MDRLNIKMHVVIGDILGWSGMRSMKAILAGERAPEKWVA